MSINDEMAYQDEIAELRARLAEAEQERDRMRHGWQRECQDGDLLLQSLGLCPSEYRSEGGSLLLGRIKHKLRPDIAVSQPSAFRGFRNEDDPSLLPPPTFRPEQPRCGYCLYRDFNRDGKCPACGKEAADKGAAQPSAGRCQCNMDDCLACERQRKADKGSA